MQALILCCVIFLWKIAYGQNYCSVCIDHTMCRFGDETGRRCGKGSEGSVTDFEIQTILQLHNDYRSKVATGRETQGTPGPQPTAANMQPLVWDQKLAEVAKRWADQCTFTHDKCRDDPRFSVGQNIYYSSGLEVKNWTRAVESWYQEVKHVNSSQVNNYEYQSATSHYAQLVWAKSRFIGCARRSFAGKYRPRGSKPLEYVLGEARKKRAVDNANKANIGYFGNNIGEIDLTAGTRGAITSKNSSAMFYAAAAAASAPANSQQARLSQSGFFGGAYSFDPNAANGAITSPTGNRKSTPVKLQSSTVKLLTKPIYVYKYTPQYSSIPAIAYPAYRPYNPTYSQYLTYKTANGKLTKGSSKDSSEESSEESSDEDSEEIKGNIVVPSSLQFKSWTKDGWQLIDYDLSIDQIYICNYGPTGNFIHDPIYITGSPCSECQSGTVCRNGLCV